MRCVFGFNPRLLAGRLGIVGRYFLKRTIECCVVCQRRLDAAAAAIVVDGISTGIFFFLFFFLVAGLPMLIPTESVNFFAWANMSSNVGSTSIGFLRLIF